MTILAFLQNMWFKNPEAARAVFERHPDRRNDLIARYLFMGCVTGKRLQQVFGEKICDEIIWEECSPEIGGRSGALFSADIAHMRAAIETHKPAIILGFGAVARDALKFLCPDIKVIHAPHPAARGNKTVEKLIAAAKTLSEVQP